MNFDLLMLVPPFRGSSAASHVGITDDDGYINVDRSMRVVGHERLYAVGDFVSLRPMDVVGFVEEIGLRTTVVRSLNGDRNHVPNSQIIAAVRSVRGYRTYTVELSQV